MINDEEFEAELSEDDEDYRPDKEVESASENSASDANDPGDSDEETKTKKTSKRKKPTRGRKSKPVESDNEEKEEAPAVDPEAEKKRADALWADFLGGTEIPIEPKEEKNTRKPATSSATTSKSVIATNIPKPKPKEIFEFAGETIDLPSKSNEEQETATPKVESKLPVAGMKRASTGGGLSSLLGQINKKNKLSVLEKTKMDWDGFKSKEGIGEELQTHNRGRDG